MLDMQEVDDFLLSNRPSAWVDVGPYKVYLRLAFHRVEGQMKKTLDLANIVKEDHVIYGGFWELFAHLSKRARERDLILYLENTYNKRLFDAYVQRGCIPTGSDCCLYRKFTNGRSESYQLV